MAKPGSYRVTYRVEFECNVEVGKGDDWQDSLSNIDIPEGGSNNSCYCENTFNIIDYRYESDRNRKALIARLMAGLETPDDLTGDEQDHLHEDLLQFLQEEHGKIEEEA